MTKLTETTTTIEDTTDDTTNDFSAFYLNEDGVVDLELPSGETMTFKGKPVRVHVFSPATKEFNRAKAEMSREVTNRVMRAAGGRSSKSIDDDEADAKFLTSITKSFENFDYPGGAAAIYRNPRLKYINTQVQSYVDSLGNFFGNSPKS